MCGPVQSLKANPQRLGIRTVVSRTQKVRFGSKTYLLNRTPKKSNQVAEALRRRNAAADAAPPASPDVCLTLPSRAGYRFALFSDAQGTPSRRVRVGQRGQAHEQVQRAADPSSQPPASHRIIGALWPDMGSAPEMAFSDGDRSYAKGHASSSRCERSCNLAEAVRRP